MVVDFGCEICNSSYFVEKEGEYLILTCVMCGHIEKVLAKYYEED